MHGWRLTIYTLFRPRRRANVLSFLTPSSYTLSRSISSPPTKHRAASLIVWTPLRKLAMHEAISTATPTRVPNSGTIPAYPNGQGRYALGCPDGEVLRPGQGIEIVLAGFQIASTVQKSDRGDYRLLHNGDRCGLCAGMRVIPLTQDRT